MFQCDFRCNMVISIPFIKGDYKLSLSLIFTGTSSSSTMVHTGLSPKNETSDRNCLHRWFPVHSNLLFSFQNNKYNNKRLHP